MTDLIDAAKDILFACPLLNKSRKKTILPVLKKEITLGASVTVCTRAPESYRLEQRDALKELITRLKENGITAKTQVELLYHQAVIDQSIVWHENIEYLSYGMKDANTLRFKSPDTAGELLDLQKKRIGQNNWKCLLDYVTAVWHSLTQQEAGGCSASMTFRDSVCGLRNIRTISRIIFAWSICAGARKLMTVTAQSISKKIYIVVKVFDRPGCLAYLCKTPNETRCLPGTLEALRAKRVQIVILDSPEIYSEYAPYSYIEDIKEFIDWVSLLNRAA